MDDNNRNWEVIEGTFNPERAYIILTGLFAVGRLTIKPMPDETLWFDLTDDNVDFLCRCMWQDRWGTFIQYRFPSLNGKAFKILTPYSLMVIRL
jgi:hypothetical protein